MSNEYESTGISKLLHQLLIEKLENEKLSHPETYAGAVRVGETMREAFISFPGCENLAPLPVLNPPQSQTA